MVFKEVEWDDVDWIDQVQDKGHWRASGNYLYHVF
jgi:hypothetical protein